MKKKKESNWQMPKGKLTRVPDFLPAPSELVFPKDINSKVTIQLSDKSIEFFKKEAKKNGTKYQTMIRTLLDHYAALHSQK